MEDKLYFEPSKKNEGKKKQIKQKKDKTSKKKDNATKITKLICFCVAIFVVLVIFFILLRGNTETNGHFPENIRNESLECIKENIEYEPTNKIKPETTTMKITMIFYGENEFNSASLKYDTFFATREEASKAESIAHAQFAKNLANSGLEFGEFDNKFSIIDNSLVITLHATSKDIDNQSSNFFLIENENGTMPSTILEYKTNYEKQNFTCKTTIDK